MTPETILALVLLGALAVTIAVTRLFPRRSESPDLVSEYHRALERLQHSQVEHLSALESLAGRIASQAERRRRVTIRPSQSTANTLINILEDVFAHEDECTLNIAYRKSAASVDLAGAARRKYVVRGGLFSQHDPEARGPHVGRDLASRDTRSA
jgi:hypothetical protein